MELSSPPKPHDIARAKIDGWRGRCLDLFAKGEKAIGQTLLCLRSTAQTGTAVKLRHLAGHRADDLAKIMPELKLTAGLMDGASTTLSDWRAFDSKRNFLAHGVLSFGLDTKGAWIAVFDMSEFRSEQVIPQRWAVTEGEANQLAVTVEETWKRLSGQLGHIRTKV